MEEEFMRQIKCPDCNETCIKHGVLKSGSQRWFCKHCKVAFTVKINNLSKELSLFLNWLFRDVYKRQLYHTTWKSGMHLASYPNEAKMPCYYYV